MITNYEDIANRLNNFYVNLGNDLANKLPVSQNNFKFYLSKANQPSEEINLTELSTAEIYRIIMKLPNKSSLGPDNLSNKVLKRIIKIPLVLQKLTKCINISILEQTFPNCLKTAKISPAFKYGTLTDPSNYRPIAQLSPISKVYEKAVR